MAGPGSTAKRPPPPLAMPPTVTTRLPVAAWAGALTRTSVALHEVAAPASTPLDVAVLLLRACPKRQPRIHTGAPTRPDAGSTSTTIGITAKLALLPATPATVTAAGPLVAQQGTPTTM